MRKYFLLSAMVLLIGAFSLSDLLGNTQIQKKHAGLKKNGKGVNCIFCHGTAADQKNPQALKTKGLVMKAKGQNTVQMKKLKSCLGAGCH